MKDIKIKRLTLENFKCHSFLNLVFEGNSTSIYGDNATGKTSIYDGLTCLLFGKDSSGRVIGEKGVNIKPLNANGEVRDHQAITSIEAEFHVDGETVTLRRTYQEIWTTRRGSSEAVYDGDTTNYFVDGVPMKKNAFDTRVRELVPEDLFRMLTSVSFFAGDMKWQDRRSVLFDMAGTMTDKEIMERDAAFLPLLESMGKLNLSEYKAKLLSQKKGLTGIRDDAPTRINECQRLLQELQGVDFNALREEAKALEAQREAISKELIALENDSALGQKQLEIRGAKLERDTLESRNKAYREQQSAAGPDLQFLRTQIDGERSRLENLRTVANRTRGSLDRYDAQIQSSREQWVTVNGESFAGGVCPTCGQALPFEQLKAATAGFEEKKQRRLADIEATATRLKDEKEAAVARLAELEEEEKERQARIAALEEQLRKAKDTAIQVKDLEDYAQQLEQINGRIQTLQREYTQLMGDAAAVRDNLRYELNGINNRLDGVRGKLASEIVKDQTEKRIAELKADARNAAEALESIEKMLYTMEEFTRFKAKFVESSINDLFRIATFRLFREQANGGLEERCDVVYNGVTYMGLNNGMKINVGIDIINALSRHYGVTVPLFVDNAEAVTRLEGCNAQVIRLVVSENDKDLRIV